MSELFLSVINMSLTASYVILLVLLVRLLLKKAPKFISYAIWGVVAIRLIVPISFQSIFSLMPWNSNAAPIPYDIVYQQSPQINSGIEAADSFTVALLPAPDTTDSVNPLQVYLEIGAYIWVSGILALLAYSFVSVLILKRQLKNAQPVEKNIFEANNLKTPFVLGLIRPKIYLPVGLNDEERGYILLHEQTHIRRKDHVIKILAFLILSVHWFNPLVWIAFVLMSADMEFSCDERVLKEMNGNIKKPYANSLLSLAAGRHILNSSPLAFGEGNVRRRIKNVLSYRKPSFWIIVSAVVIAIAVSVGLLTNPREQEPAPGSKDSISYENIRHGNEPAKSITIIDKPEEDKVCIGIRTTEQANREVYYVLDDKLQKELSPLLNNIEKKPRTEVVFKGRYYTGINIVYQGLEWQILSDGTLYYFSSGDIDYLSANKELCEKVLQIAERDLGIVPFNPKIIRNIKSAEFTAAFSNNKERVFTQTIKDSSALTAIEKLLSEAEIIHGGSGCPFTEGIMTLELENGQPIKISMATDSCCAYFVNGMYFDYKPEESRGKEDSGITNNIIFKYFDKVPVATRGKEQKPDPQEVTLEPSVPGLTPEQTLGVGMPVLDYASDDIVIFHSYFGLFVYDLNKLQIIRSIDLKPLNCHMIQGSNTCEVSVSEDGNTVQLHPMESENMYIYTVSSHTLKEASYQRMENCFRGVPIEDAVDSEMLGLYSYNAVKFGKGEYGYLYASDWTLGALSYVRSDRSYQLFNNTNS